MSGRQKSSSTAYGEQYEKTRGAVWRLCQTAPQSIPPYRLPHRHILSSPGMHATCLHTPACITRGSKHFILTETVEMRKTTIVVLRCNILSVVKHFIAYGTISVLFRAEKQYCFEITYCLLGWVSSMLHRPTQGWTVGEYILRCQSIHASSTVQPWVGR